MDLIKFGMETLERPSDEKMIATLRKWIEEIATGKSVGWEKVRRELAGSKYYLLHSCEIPTPRWGEGKAYPEQGRRGEGQRCINVKCVNPDFIF